MQKILKREISVDLIKIVAMLAVIGLHTLKASEDWRVANVFYETFVIAIPLFFMSSGYCLLGRSDVTTGYAIRKIGGITKFVFMLTLVVWSVRSLSIGVFSWEELIKTFGRAFLQEGSLWICWYLGAMIILYMFLPLLNYLYLQKRKSFCLILTYVFIVEFLVFSENLNNEGVCLEAQVPQTFRIWNWFFYFMLGGVIRDVKIVLGNATKIIGLLCLFSINILFQEKHKEAIHSIYCEYFYCSIVVILLCALIFKIVLDMNIAPSPIIRQLSKLFLPVYILHPFIIKLLNSLNLFSSISCDYVPVFMFLITVIISVSVAYCLMSIPLISKIFRI